VTIAGVVVGYLAPRMAERHRVVIEGALAEHGRADCAGQIELADSKYRMTVLIHDPREPIASDVIWVLNSESGTRHKVGTDQADGSHVAACGITVPAPHVLHLRRTTPWIGFQYPDGEVREAGGGPCARCQ
jgi:hypothetical protein